MITQIQPKKILINVRVDSKSNWSEDIVRLSTLGINEIALFIETSVLNQRKEVYQLLEKNNLQSIPYVQLSSNFEEGEMDYLVTKYGTSVFGLYLNNSSLNFIASLVNFTSLIAPENPFEDKFAALFTDETLTRSNVSGVCLDISTLEYKRLHNKKKYQLAVHTLDHHSLMATQVGPVSANFFKRMLHVNYRHLTTLSDLHYLKNVPKTYLADLIVLDVRNSLEEQIEIKNYLELIFK